MKDLLPDSLLVEIANQYRRAAREAVEDYAAQQADEDGLTGALGSVLRRGVRGTVVRHDVQYEWHTQLVRVRGRGPGAPEKQLGADAILQIEVRNAAGAIVRVKALPVQAKKGWDGADGKLAAQTETMIAACGSGIVVDYGPNTYMAANGPDVVAASGNKRNLQPGQVRPLGDVLADDFIPCKLGTIGAHYDPAREEIVRADGTVTHFLAKEVITTSIAIHQRSSTATEVPDVKPPSNSLDVFSLRDSVINEYRRFATSFTTIHAQDIRAQVEAIYAQGRFWPDPLIQINPNYKRGANLSALIEAGALDPRTAEIFRADGAPLSLYKHQEQAIALASHGESFVVTTGTGSGKSLCFFIPIVSAVLTEKRTTAAKRTRAIIIYPMNALANSQLEELHKFVANVPGERPVTFARYTGQEDADERRAVADNPPDILLTNFMMLELLMTRQDEIDRRVIGNCAGLRFLVLDELHTYRGRQGADVALLVRRVRERLSPDKLQCIGTSATMASEGTVRSKQEVVAGVASKLFSTNVDPSHVIIEELERVTDKSKRAETVKSLLGAAIDAGIAPSISNETLRTHPLAIWTETRLGITTTESNPAWHRARPRTLDEAARELAAESGRDELACRSALRSLLLISSLPERDRLGNDNGAVKSFFAFKLHQFISGAGHAFSTLEPAGKRTVTVADENTRLDG